MKNNTYGTNSVYIQKYRIGADEIELFREHGHYYVRRRADSVDGKTVVEAYIKCDSYDAALKAFDRQVNIAKSINEGIN